LVGLDKARNRFCQRLFFAVKADDHCRHDDVWIDLVRIKRVPCTFCQQNEEGQLRTPVSFAERVNGIELRQKMCRFPGEFSWI
jgi:hypothetical protein